MWPYISRLQLSSCLKKVKLISVCAMHTNQQSEILRQHTNTFEALFSCFVFTILTITTMFDIKVTILNVEFKPAVTWHCENSKYTLSLQQFSHFFMIPVLWCSSHNSLLWFSCLLITAVLQYFTEELLLVCLFLYNPSKNRVLLSVIDTFLVGSNWWFTRKLCVGYSIFCLISLISIN